jgi:hypothetical protein
MKKIGMLFGEGFYIDTDNENKVKMATKWFEHLEAREVAVGNKEIELEMKHYSNN